MRKVSFFGVAAVFMLIGVGVWTVATTRTLADSTGINPSELTSGKDLPTSHYDDYSVVFN